MPERLRVLLIGDIVGRPGRRIVAERLVELRSRYRLDLVVANAENAAGGSGLTPVFFHELRDAGVDGMTLGDHAFRQREIFGILDSSDRIVRPGNFPAESPGRGWTILHTADGIPVAIMALLGRTYMQPLTDCPYHAAERMLEEIRRAEPSLRVVLLDFHAEATSEKQLMGRFLDGRIGAVLGTHTHVATADETILPGGTAFQCDIGMTGPYESILGRRIDRVIETMTTLRPVKFDVASHDVRLVGTVVEFDTTTGLAAGIERLSISHDCTLP